MSESLKDSLIDFPGLERIVTEFALYQRVPITDSIANRSHLTVQLGVSVRINCWCVECADYRTFVVANVVDASYKPPVDLGFDASKIRSRSREGHAAETQKIRLFTLNCTYQPAHQLFLILAIDTDFVMKIGQYPSGADLVKPDLKKYNSVLSKEKFEELRRAVGLNAHGVGIGAFVYLRRIFEDQIEKARLRAASISGWDQEKFVMSRMDDKIKLLRLELPKHLIINSHIYSILSSGIHELSEDECLQHFEAMFTAIQLILDQEFDERNRARKEAENTAAIQKINKKS